MLFLGFGCCKSSRNLILRGFKTGRRSGPRSDLLAVRPTQKPRKQHEDKGWHGRHEERQEAAVEVVGAGIFGLEDCQKEQRRPDQDVDDFQKGDLLARIAHPQEQRVANEEHPDEGENQGVVQDDDALEGPGVQDGLGAGMHLPIPEGVFCAVLGPPCRAVGVRPAGELGGHGREFGFVPVKLVPDPVLEVAGNQHEQHHDRPPGEAGGEEGRVWGGACWV